MPLTPQLVRVLLIEDDEDDYQLTADLLGEIETQRFSLDWVASYEAAETAIARREHDVYLVDYRLGPREGVKLLELPALKGKPVIMLTGLDNPEVDRQAMEAGAADYLVKGRIDAAMLERSIRYAIERKRVEGRLREAQDELERRVLERTAELERSNASLRSKIEEHQRAEDRFRALLESAPDAMVIVNTQGEIVLVNSQTEKLFGYARQELIGQLIEILVPEPVRAEHAQQRNAYFAHPQLRPMGAGLELYGLRRNGTQFPVEISLSPIQTQEGLLMVSAIRDGTERKQAEESLRLSEARFRLMADAMPQIVWVTRPDGVHEYYNQQWYDYTGLSREQGLGEGWATPLHPDDRQRALEQWNLALQTGEPYEIEHRFRGKDGQYRWFLARALPVRDEHGRIIRWFGTCTDIDDKKQMEVELREQAEALHERDRRKDEFLALLSHELRNPLAAIYNGLHILLMPNLEPAPARQVKEMMAKQVHHLTRMVDDLLDVSRITRGKIQLRKEKVNLAEAVSHAVESVMSLMDAQNHRLTVTLPPQGVHLEADPTRLEQILVNLLTNAAKYTRQGGRISLTAERDGDQAVIRVRDNGVGIRADILPTIFDLFVQVDRTLDRSQGGLGIGLTLVKRLVELHGGSIQPFSEGPDKGSEFVVRLPALRSAADAVDGAPSAPTPGMRRQRVLVVDDSEDLAQSLKILLEFSGHEVRVVGDGHAALVAFRNYHPDVVLLDIGLPGMNGYEVVGQLRKEEGTKRPLVVAVSGYGQEEDKRRAHEAGFDLHMTKPVDPDKIGAIIASAPTLVTRYS